MVTLELCALTSSSVTTRVTHVSAVRVVFSPARALVEACSYLTATLFAQVKFQHQAPAKTIIKTLSKQKEPIEPRRAQSPLKFRQVRAGHQANLKGGQWTQTNARLSVPGCQFKLC